MFKTSLIVERRIFHDISKSEAEELKRMSTSGQNDVSVDEPQSETEPPRSALDALKQQIDEESVQPERKDKAARLRSFWSSDSAISAILAGIVVIVTSTILYKQTEQISREEAYAEFIQTRIGGCFALASVHQEYARIDAERDYVESTPLTLADGTPVTMTGNQDRFGKAIIMSRELLLCIVDSEENADLRDCVHRIHAHHASVYVYDYIGDDPSIYGKIPEAGEEFAGQRNVIC